MKKPKPNQAKHTDGSIDWAKQCAWDVEFAKRVLLDRGEIAPMYVMHTPRGIIPIATDLADKPRVRALVQLMCFAHGAIGLTFIGEAWMKAIEDDEALRPGESLADLEQRIVLPSESERRVEIVSVVTLYYDATGARQSTTILREILRGADGKPTGLGAEISAADAMIGPGAEILPERRATPDEQAAAKQVLDVVEQAGVFETRMQPSA